MPCCFCGSAVGLDLLLQQPEPTHERALNMLCCTTCASTVCCAALQCPLPHLCNIMQSEVSELFGVVDVRQRGEVGRAELAAGLIDWKAFEVGCTRAASCQGCTLPIVSEFLSGGRPR